LYFWTKEANEPKLEMTAGIVIENKDDIFVSLNTISESNVP